MTEPTPASVGSLMALRSEAHKDGILSKFDRLRKRDLLCDTTLIVEEVHFKAHKALLAASSEYFSLMFTAEDQINQSTYRLDGMASDYFAVVLEFIYRAQVSVEESGAEQLLAMARLLEVSDLVKALGELATTTTTTTPAEVNAEFSNLPKRKRGRPRKNVIMTVTEERRDDEIFIKVVEVEDEDDGGDLHEISDGGDLHEISDGGDPHEISDGGAPLESSDDEPIGDNCTPNCDAADEYPTVPQHKDSDDADYEPRADLPRQSRRKIRPPMKYKGYRVDNDSVGNREPGKRGRRRKYPDTEARCEDCGGKVFKNHLFLKIHQRTHTGEKPFRCHVCGKGFTQKHTLVVHQRMHTGEKPFICTVCSKALSTKHSLLEHMNLHAEQKSFSCDKCGKTFTQKRQLKSHYRLHTGKSLPECALCNHKFMDTAQLKKHLRIHTGEKPFTCEICGKCFTAKSTLQTHIRIHRGEKPYDCSLCDKSFSDPSARRRHVASHSGKKPFTCSLCSLSFTRLDNLKTHTKSHNKERATAEPYAEDGPGETGAAMANEEVRDILQLQQYHQLPPSSEQEIQLVVTGDVGNMDFVPGQEQQISIIGAEGEPSVQSHPRLTLMTEPSAHVQNVALVSQGGVLDQSQAQVQTISVLDGQVGHGGQSEQMQVITLSKETMERLQAHHGPPQPLQIAQRPLQQMMNQPIQQVAISQEPGPLQGQEARGQHVQAIHINSQSTQPISISQTNEQISNHHIQGQTFQIQAGTVSYLYTTSLPQES